MNEFTIFEKEMKSYSEFLMTKNYHFKEYSIFSGNPTIRFIYSNNVLNKVITFDFSPSYGSIIQSRITVIISNLTTNQAIDISMLLAYLEKNDRVTWQDQSKYFFRFDSDNISESIHEVLLQISDVLENEAKSIFTTNDWFAIPIHDPRDDY